MDLILRTSGGQNVVLRPQARAAWHPAPTVDAHECEVFVQESDPATGAFIGGLRPIGRFPSAAEIVIPFTPDEDHNLIVYIIPYAADGTPGAPSVRQAQQFTVIFNRVTEAPTLTQVGDAGAELLTVAVDAEDQRFVRKRRTKISPDADMSDASVTVREFGAGEVPRLLDIDRTAALVAAFSWAGNDPAADGFTKTGSGTTAASNSPAGWKITTNASDAATTYSKSGWPAEAFAAGFTLELLPPLVINSDAALPNDSVILRVRDGATRYDLRFSATSVYLNGGAARVHGGARVRLVVAPGGLVADLWVGDTKVENDTAGIASASTGLVFGDLSTGDDSEAVWSYLAYALTPQDPRLAETIYVTVEHSGGGAWAPASGVATFTFASEVTGEGGSSGDGDMVSRDRYTIE